MKTIVYLITWCIIAISPITYNVGKDEFGRSNIQTIGINADTTLYLKRSFTIKDSANAFLKRLKDAQTKGSTTFTQPYAGDFIGCVTFDSLIKQ